VAKLTANGDTWDAAASKLEWLWRNAIWEQDKLRLGKVHVAVEDLEEAERLCRKKFNVAGLMLPRRGGALAATEVPAAANAQRTDAAAAPKTPTRPLPTASGGETGQPDKETEPAHRCGIVPRSALRGSAGPRKRRRIRFSNTTREVEIKNYRGYGLWLTEALELAHCDMCNTLQPHSSGQVIQGAAFLCDKCIMEADAGEQ